MTRKTVTYTDDNPTVSAAGKAQVRKGRWVAVKVKNTVCEPDAEAISSDVFSTKLAYC